MRIDIQSKDFIIKETIAPGSFFKIKSSLLPYLIGRKKFRGFIEIKSGERMNCRQYRRALRSKNILVFYFDKESFLDQRLSLEAIIKEAFNILCLPQRSDLTNSIIAKLDLFDIAPNSYLEELSSGQQAIFKILLSMYLPVDIAVLPNIFANISDENIKRFISLFEQERTEKIILYNGADLQCLENTKEIDAIARPIRKTFVPHYQIEKKNMFTAILCSLIFLLLPSVINSIVLSDLSQDYKKIYEASSITESYSRGPTIPKMIQADDYAEFASIPLIIGQQEFTILPALKYGSVRFSRIAPSEDEAVFSLDFFNSFAKEETMHSYLEMIFGFTNYKIDKELKQKIIIPVDQFRDLNQFDFNGNFLFKSNDIEVYDKKGEKTLLEKDKVYLPFGSRNSNISHPIGGYYYAKFDSNLILCGSEIDFESISMTRFNMIKITNNKALMEESAPLLNALEKKIIILETSIFIFSTVAMSLSFFFAYRQNWRKNLRLYVNFSFPFRLGLLMAYRDVLKLLPMIILYPILLLVLTMSNQLFWIVVVIYSLTLAISLVLLTIIYSIYYRKKMQ